MPLQTQLEAKTHATFDALMWAFAHPGRVQALQLEPDENAFFRIAQALLDLETSAWTNDAALEPQLCVLGAKMKSLKEADYVFCANTPVSDLLHVIKRGSPVAPETSATLVVSAALEIGRLVRLTGAGIQSSLELQIDVPPEFWQTREQIMSYPIGWDLLLTNGSSLVGIPRTTRIEVL